MSILIFRLLLGFIPLLVYIIAESIWGTTVGIAVGVGTGVVEFLIVLVRQKRVDWFVVLDTALLVVLGVLSIGSDEGLFFKLKPALMDFVLVALLVFSVAGPRNLVLGMMLRNVGEANRARFEQAEGILKPLLWALAALLFLHGLATAAVALWATEAVWIFVSGPLLYIVLGAGFVAELVWLRLRARSARAGLRSNRATGHIPGGNEDNGRGLPGEEMLPVVDLEGKVIGKAPRSVCHQSPGLLHPVVRLMVFDKDGKVLLQKRSADKDSWPGAWDTSSAGHIGFGETAEQALARESTEEIGLTLNADAKQVSFVAKYVSDNESASTANSQNVPAGKNAARKGFVDKELSFLFKVKITEDEKKRLLAQESEVAELRWFEPASIERVLAFGETLTPNLLRDLEFTRTQKSKLPR